MLKKYENYLGILNGYLTKYFDNQREYIHCKAGCAICCEHGQYPYSELEYKYLAEGFNKLEEKTKVAIKSIIQEIKNEQSNSKEEKFFYKCPLLLEGKCSVYEHRGIICRIYGLMYFYEDKEGNDKFSMPCCVSNGLNYSEVYDEETKTISGEKYRQSGITAEPLSYNLGLKYLLNNEFTKELEFGSNKSLIDWFD